MSVNDLHEKLKKEREFLNKLYTNYSLDTEPQTRVMREFIFRILKPYIKGGKGLELGCSDGYMTEMIASRVSELDVIDASTQFIKEAGKRKLKNVCYINSLFEEYKTQKKYDYVFASYILEHVLEVALVLNMVKNVIAKDGLLFIVVPNARALSRQLALHMNLYSDLKELTENDLKFGHRRVFDRIILNREVEKDGFTTISQGGIMLKILADFQMDKLIELDVLQEPQLEGLYKLGLEYPDLSGSLFSICKLKGY